MSKNIPIQPIHFYDHHIGAVREGFKNPPTENNFPVPSNTGTYFVWVTHVHPNLTPNRYIVSNMGKVYDLFNNGVEIPVYKSTDSYNTYYRVHLSYMSDPYTIKDYNYDIGRIVLLSFNYIPNCENLQVAHLDFDKSNNALSNLRWVTSNEGFIRAKIADQIKDIKKRDITRMYDPIIPETEGLGIIICDAYHIPPLEISSIFNIATDLIINFISTNKKYYNYMPDTSMLTNIINSLPYECAEQIVMFMIDHADEIINGQIKDDDIAQMFNIDNKRAIQKIRLGTGYKKITSKYPEMLKIQEAFKKGT